MRILAVVVFLVAVLLGYNLYDEFDPECLEGKRVLVTGASMGIGEQMAYHYARMGANVMVTARTERKLEQVVTKCKELGNPNKIYDYVTGDMSNMEDTLKVMQKTKEVLGGLDYLVLNHIMVVPLGVWSGHQANLTLLDKIFNINFKAYVYLATHAMPMLEESRGSLIVVSSIAGKIGMPYVAPYSAAKFALDGFFSALRLELEIRQVDVSISLCVIGLIGTDNTVKGLRNFGLDFLLNNLHVASPADTAYAIIRGGTLRHRQVYYPYFEARLPLLARDWVIYPLEQFIKFFYSRS